eukprot:CAMPEP_0168520446 /NCGR_PEP_ID=MMETSP0405-20121227/8000_1 /TAXON_ID=498012 /ORGANISM="Trichosphaerium sp, Strain Am-I-7 wt" /LENGTH=195 /DNA_ID=CAMNT_0008541345 /DNA_START=633 /DNA_END=1216 /DNA_ORIENTATION=-
MMYPKKKKKKSGGGGKNEGVVDTIFIRSYEVIKDIVVAISQDYLWVWSKSHGKKKIKVPYDITAKAILGDKVFTGDINKQLSVYSIVDGTKLYNVNIVQVPANAESLLQQVIHKTHTLEVLGDYLYVGTQHALSIWNRKRKDQVKCEKVLKLKEAGVKAIHIDDDGWVYAFAEGDKEDVHLDAMLGWQIKKEFLP